MYSIYSDTQSTTVKESEPISSSKAVRYGASGVITLKVSILHHR